MSSTGIIGSPTGDAGPVAEVRVDELDGGAISIRKYRPGAAAEGAIVHVIIGILVILRAAVSVDHPVDTITETITQVDRLGGV
ncbi:MAG: hypothetical protein MK133_14470, partial [Planctomycetes bacterium]|nr:hypothetical protein [Planctomycetota bacterium]